MRKLATLIPLTLLALATPLIAGTVVKVERRDLPDGTPSPLVMSIDGDLVAISGDADEGRMILRGDRQQMLIVDDAKKSYLALDEAMAVGIAKQLDAATQQMEAAIARLPADQQAMARRLMQQQQQQQPQLQPGAQAARAAALEDTRTVQRTAETATREGYPCVKYEVFEQGEKVRELWVTEWSNVEGHAQLEAAMKAVDDFVGKLTASFGKLGAAGSSIGAGTIATWWHGIPGMPVVTTDFEDGVATEESVVRSIDRTSVDHSTFEVPADYTEKKIGG